MDRCVLYLYRRLKRAGRTKFVAFKEENPSFKISSNYNFIYNQSHRAQTIKNTRSLLIGLFVGLGKFHGLAFFIFFVTVVEIVEIFFTKYIVLIGGQYIEQHVGFLLGAHF